MRLFELLAFCVLFFAAPPDAASANRSDRLQSGVTHPAVEWLGDRTERSGPDLSAPSVSPASDARGAEEVDRREVNAPQVRLRPVILYTKAGCVPCVRLVNHLEQLAKDRKPFALPIEQRQAPEGVWTPSFLFQSLDGNWWSVAGLATPEATLANLLAEHQKKCGASPRFLEQLEIPQNASATGSAGETVAEMARRFAGTRGRFSFEPSGNVNTTAADGVTVRYGKVTGSYDLSTDNPVITLDAPQPEGSARVAGLWVGFRILGATVSPEQNLVAVRTNWRTVELQAKFKEGGPRR